jgi:hypothetical protein
MTGQQRAFALLACTGRDEVPTFEWRIDSSLPARKIVSHLHDLNGFTA